MENRKRIYISMILLGMVFLFNNCLAAGKETKTNLSNPTEPPIFKEQQPKENSQIDIVKIDNYIINPVTVKFLSNAINNAVKNNAACLIIELDTPGGLLESTRDIVKEILNSQIPIVTYISPSGSRAGSAGVFITYASHIAAMAPSTNIGAAHPVGIGFSPAPEKKENDKKNKSKDEDILTEKIMNDMLAWVEGIAKARNRNVQWVKKAVTKSVSVTETEAVKEKIVDFIAVDLQDLIKKIDEKVVQTKYGPKTIDTKYARLNFIELSGRERILNTIAHPNIAYLLMMLGVLGLIFEFSTPGFGFSGIIGFICLLLAMYSFQLLPINYAGLILIVLSIILFIAEALTPATFGLLTLCGIISMTLGSLFLIKDSYPSLRISLSYIIPTVLTMSALSIFIVGNAIKTHRKKAATGKEGLINLEANTTTALNPEGKVFCRGEIWNAVSLDNKKIEKNQKVTVVKVEGLKLFVKEMHE